MEGLPDRRAPHRDRAALGKDIRPVTGQAGSGLSVRETFERAALSGESPVLLTGPAIRPYVRSIIERFRGQTPVMSQNEVHPRARLKTVGTI